MTDVEGDIDFFFRYVGLSSVISASDLQYTSSRDVASFKLDFLPQADGREAHFVFGGDLFDHGPGDLRLAAALVDFKERFPERVHLIAGNRDLNKLRLLTELDDRVLALPPSHPSTFYPYWQKPKFVTTLAQYMEQRARAPRDPEYGVLDFVPRSWREADASRNGSASEDLNRIERLRWILRHTMGAPNAFENRRRELAILKLGHEEDISDADVFLSFRESVEQHGIVRAYLEHTQLMLILGDTMFVHGALRDESIGWVPPMSSCPSCPPSTHTDAHTWCNALNDWQKDQMRSWRSAGASLTDEPFFKRWEQEETAAMTAGNMPQQHPMRLRAGGNLMDYGVPGGSQGRAVVHASWLDAEHHPDPAASGSDRVGTMLRAAGIKRVVTGHVPHGDCPTVLRGGSGSSSDDTSFSVIMCDTTYCAGTPGDWHSRGESVVEVLVDSDANIASESKSSCRIHGALVDGAPFDFRVEDWAQEIGRILPDGRYVGHPRTDTGEFAVWFPGKPFPSNLEQSSLPFARVRGLLREH